MASLIKRAQTIREESPNPPSTGEEEFVFDESSGISKEEQKEIITKIDHLVTDNRIQVTPEILKISPIKKGFIFPLLVNGFFLFVLAAGVLVLVLLFRRGQGLILEETGTVSSAEGVLLQELKRESEEKLLEKNREIQNIQSQLSSLDRERQDLEENMSQRVQEREDELRTQLEAELDAERARLRAQGISEDDIEARLSALESQKTSEYDQKLDEFKREAVAEKQRIEENLRQLQDDYNRSLSKANEERQQILAESKKREEELRNQLEEKTRELEAATSETKRELRRLSELKEQEEIINTQLIGLYNTVRRNIREGRLNEALVTLDSIRDFLNDESVMDLPAIQQRREVEFFVVDSISRLVEDEMAKKSVDTDGLLASANLVTAMKEKALLADRYLRDGNTERAEALYREVLGMIPEVDKTHNYFLSKMQRDDQNRRALLDTYMQRAEESFSRKAFAETLQNYTKALEYLPEEPAAIQRMVSNMREAGYVLGTTRDQKRDTEAAADPYQKAETLLQDKRYNDAILAYLDVVNRYPRSDQAKTALDGIKRAIDLKGGTSSDSLTVLETTLNSRLEEISQLKQESAEKDEKIQELEAGLVNLQDAREREAESYQERISDLEASVALLEERLSGQGSASGTESGSQLEQRVRQLELTLRASESERDELQIENASLRRDIDRLKNEIAKLKGQPGAVAGSSKEVSSDDLEKLVVAEKSYREIRGRYSEYADLEDNIIKQQGTEGLFRTKLYLDEFLSYPTMEASFPGFWRRIKTYDQAFEREGRQAALQDVIDIVNDLSEVVGDSQRVALLDSEIERNSRNPLTIELLTELRNLIRSQ